MEPPSLWQQADGLVGAGRPDEAWRLLAGAAARSDAEALRALAYWRLVGDVVHRDLAASRDLFRRAAEAGDPEAAAIHTAFVAQGTGGATDWPLAMELLRRRTDPAATEQRTLIEKMELTEAGDPGDMPPPEPLSDRPSVTCFRGLLTAEECAFLIAEAAPWLGPSLVIDPRTGRHHRNPIRTSDAMAFAFTQENPAIRALNRRIAAATATDVARGEPLQILRYRPGQEYRPHFDAVTGDANQRVLTVLVYLTEGYSGGETLFASTGLKFRGRRGDALMFRNASDDGRPDPLAQHAGLPVESGEKIIASRWIRVRPFVLPPPTPLLDL